MNRRTYLRLAATSLAASLATQARAQTTPLDTLIRAARAEGELVFYASPVESVVRRITDKFTAAYGIKASFLRLTGGALRTRFATEAESGNSAADLVIMTGALSSRYASDAAAKGWVQRLPEANLPAAATFPARFLTESTAILQTAPWLAVVNTEKTNPAEYPRDWTDLTAPSWRNRLIIPNPLTSEVHLEFWRVMLDQYGEGFLAALRDQNPRHADSGVPAAQALAAGEGALTLPNIVPVVQSLTAKGAPLKSVMLDLTTGVEQHVMLTAPNRSKHPNAARLFANWLMSPEGNKVFNDDPDQMTVYESAKLPKRYVSPPANAVESREKIGKLLGFG